jgi:murein DD-endopeptidase MepM/ murein hydrolase activator NlpD
MLNDKINGKSFFIATKKEFMNTWFVKGTDPDGNRLSQIIVGDGSDAKESYNIYLSRKLQEQEYYKNLALLQELKSQVDESFNEILNPKPLSLGQLDEALQSQVINNTQQASNEALSLQDSIKNKLIHQALAQKEEPQIPNLPPRQNNQPTDDKPTTPSASPSDAKQGTQDNPVQKPSQNHPETPKQEEMQDTSQMKRPFIWRTMEDSKVRSSHQELDGKVFDWESQSQKPGEEYGCRCYAEFVGKHGNQTGDYGRLKWPVKGSELNPKPYFEPSDKNGTALNENLYKTEKNKQNNTNLNATEWQEKWDKNIGPNKFSSYGKKRLLPHYDKPKVHKGDDIALPFGTRIPSVKNGKIVANEFNKNGYGNYIKTKNDDGTYSLYAHMKEKSNFTLGQKISQGDIIGYVGSTGGSTGNHLHYGEQDFNQNNIEPSDLSRQYLFDYYSKKF